MSSATPRQPATPQIRFAAVPGGVELSWRRRTLSARVVNLAVSALSLAAGIAIEAFIVAKFRRAFIADRDRVLIAFLAAGAGFWTLIMVSSLVDFAKRFLPGVPESLHFAGGKLVHDSGSSPPEYSLQARGPAKAVAMPPPRAVREARRERLGEIRLERIGPSQRQRLTYDLGRDRIEVGPTLAEADREWLAEALRRWRETGEAPPSRRAN